MLIQAHSTFAICQERLLPRKLRSSFIYLFFIFSLLIETLGQGSFSRIRVAGHSKTKATFCTEALTLQKHADTLERNFVKKFGISTQFNFRSLLWHGYFTKFLAWMIAIVFPPRTHSRLDYGIIIPTWRLSRERFRSRTTICQSFHSQCHELWNSMRSIVRNRKASLIRSLFCYRLFLFFAFDSVATKVPRSLSRAPLTRFSKRRCAREREINNKTMLEKYLSTGSADTKGARTRAPLYSDDKIISLSPSNTRKYSSRKYPWNVVHIET